MDTQDTEPSLEEKVDALRRQFLAGLPQRLSSIQLLLDGLRRDPGGRAALYQEIHSLTGSLGLYGYTETMRLARRLCNLMSPNRSDADVHDDLDTLNTLYRKLQQDVGRLLENA